MKQIDGRGISCPRPMVLAKQAITKAEFPVEIFVDTAIVCKNIQRLAERSGCKVEVLPIEDKFQIIILR
jgi:tRNA 2-thiouridine synthesizing protein A